jgi:hypothetical protein
MSATKILFINNASPETQTLIYEVNGVPVNMTSGYNVEMRFWRDGISTTSVAEFTASTATSHFTLGTTGQITILFYTFNASLNAISPIDVLWHYDLTLIQYGVPNKQILNGTLVRIMP